VNHNLHKYSLFILFYITLCSGQVSLSIAEYRPFPEKIHLLDIKPTKVSWTIANRFLLFDQYKRELLELDAFGDVNLSSGVGQNISGYEDLVWMGISPQGILLVDRLENEIVQLDFRLNPVQTIDLNRRIFPEDAALDPWGRLYLYSRDYNSIFLFDKGELDPTPIVNLSKELGSVFCMAEMQINQEGEMAILGCDGMIHIFSQNGRKKISFPSTIENAVFLIAVRDDWFVFNRMGAGISIHSQKKVSIPGASIPIEDMASMNRSIAVLAKDHILILDVK
jgi:hypothetical protein